jgi:hypothetical protein
VQCVRYVQGAQGAQQGARAAGSGANRGGRVVEAADLEHLDAQRRGGHLTELSALRHLLEVTLAQASDARAAVWRIKWNKERRRAVCARRRHRVLWRAQQRIRHRLPLVVAHTLNLPVVVRGQHELVDVRRRCLLSGRRLLL